MITSVFASGTSYASGPLDYLLKKKDRAVNPIVLRGDPLLIGDLIDSIHRKWKYTSGVLRFHLKDSPAQEQLDDIMDSFQNFMFAGKARDTFDLLWVLHTDKGATELHFLIPRVDIETGQDLNIAPPGYADQFKVWTEKINTTYGFANPLKRTAKKKIKREPETSAKKREQVYEDMIQLVDEGTIRSREDLITELNRIGEVRSTNPNVKFIAVKFDGFDRRIRFDGGIFARDYDFNKMRPGNSQRSNRSMSDNLAEKPKVKRPPYRFEDPSADPFGDQNVYEKDIEERYDSAFNYRRERFSRIRNKSRKLQQLKTQAVNIEAIPDTPNPRQEDHPEDVERIREARRRTRDRKHTLAELSRVAANAARQGQQAITRIGKYLRQAIERCREALKNRQSPLSAEERYDRDVNQWKDYVDQHAGIIEWITKLRNAVTKSIDPPVGQLEVVHAITAKQIIARRSDILTKVDEILETVPHAHREAIRAMAHDTVAFEIKRANKVLPHVRESPKAKPPKKRPGPSIGFEP